MPGEFEEDEVSKLEEEIKFPVVDRLEEALAKKVIECIRNYDA